VVVDRHLFMNTTTGTIEEVSLMSTIAAAPGFGTRRPAATRRVAHRTAAAPVDVRLTRRGRLVLLVLFLGLVTAALMGLGGQSAATGEAGDPVPTRTVVVHEGDTLWAIASEVAAPGDVREMIHQIEELNALSGASLSEGQEIAVPVG
jgi:LysM domain-containing protein